MSATMEYGFRGEDIRYRDAGRELEIEFTWVNGPRIYPRSIDRWQDGEPLTEEEKVRVLLEAMRFVTGGREKPIIVISAEDPDRALWEQLCDEHRPAIRDVELTSDAEALQREREMYLAILKSGTRLVIDGADVRTEQQLDELLQRRTRGGGE